MASSSSSSSISTIISNYYYYHNSTSTNNSVVFSANSRLLTPKINLIGTTTTTPTPTRFRLTVVRALKDNKTTDPPPSAEEDITKKYGLEAGLWKIFSSGSSSEEGEGEGEEKGKGKGEKAKELLTKYGGAYLATSITLSLISFSLCYALISAGVDVSALLTKVGITSNETGEKLGTFALAYAAHKAASPIRFPPTVALTPIVASWINKNKNTT